MKAKKLQQLSHKTLHTFRQRGPALKSCPPAFVLKTYFKFMYNDSSDKLLHQSVIIRSEKYSERATFSQERLKEEKYGDMAQINLEKNNEKCTFRRSPFWHVKRYSYSDRKYSFKTLYWYTMSSQVRDKQSMKSFRNCKEFS